MFLLRCTKCLLFISLIAWQLSTANAGVITSPSGPNPGGNGQGFAPFTIRGDTNGNRYQQVFSSEFFQAVGDSQSITAIAFRQKQGAFGSFISSQVTFSQISFGLSTTLRDANTDFPNGLSADLNSNVGADAVSVYSGSLTLTSASTSSFDYLIQFQTPFLYRPDLGNLLLEVIIPPTATVTTPGSIGYTQLAQYTDAFPSRDGTASAFDGNLLDGSSIGGNSTTGAVVQFTTNAVNAPNTANAVPEPVSGGIFAMLALSSCLFNYRCRRLDRATE